MIIASLDFDDLPACMFDWTLFATVDIRHLREQFGRR